MNGSNAVAIAAVLESAVKKMIAALPDRSSFFSPFIVTFSISSGRESLLPERLLSGPAISVPN
jgi:hypothetical protein